MEIPKKQKMSATQRVSSGSKFDSFIDEREKKKYYASKHRICKIRIKNWLMKIEDMKDKNLELMKLEKY